MSKSLEYLENMINSTTDYERSYWVLEGYQTIVQDLENIEQLKKENELYENLVIELQENRNKLKILIEKIQKENQELKKFETDYHIALAFCEASLEEKQELKKENQEKIA